MLSRRRYQNLLVVRVLQLVSAHEGVHFTADARAALHTSPLSTGTESGINLKVKNVCFQYWSNTIY